jgi:uncharacterized protein (DUF4415 family)
MKKDADTNQDDELRAEYDFSALAGGVRGKYEARYKECADLVRLDADVARAFPTEKAVNDALRQLMEHTSASS